MQAEGARVVTVEGLSSDEALSPPQSAFRKHHALQCGFRTPGMLTTAHAPLTEEPEAGRRSHPLRPVGQFVPLHRLHPDRRSGARSARRLPEGRQAMIGTNRYIGSPVEGIEDPRFLRGRGQFVGDLKRESMLYAAILRSPVAHGLVAAVDASAALAIAGVRAVITAKDIGAVPRIPLRLLPLPGTERFLQPVIAADRVRYVGEPVAVVLGDSPALAEDGVGAIALDIEGLPPVPDRDISGRDEILLFGPGRPDRE